jgi:hypothetical protein
LKTHSVASTFLACFAGVLGVSCAATLRRPAAGGIAPVAEITPWWILIGRSASFNAIDWRQYDRGTEMVILNDDPGIAFGAGFVLVRSRLRTLLADTFQSQPFGAAT